MFDPAEFEDAFQAALPGHQHAVKASFMGAEPQALFGTTFTFDTFCKAWPIIKGFIMLAVTLLGLFRPAAAAATAAFVTAVDAKLLQWLCPVTPPTA